MTFDLLILSVYLSWWVLCSISAAPSDKSERGPMSRTATGKSNPEVFTFVNNSKTTGSKKCIL